ncbi:MAG: hypothetical protein FWE20_12470, partial [Defluviitaleaceae bacterium]|nr:hypothetical protein [Defluviitaleaceae bacterium]
SPPHKAKTGLYGDPGSSVAPPTLALRMLNVCHRHTASLRTAWVRSVHPTKPKPGFAGTPGVASS